MGAARIELGDKVKCRVTGFTGIAVARTIWLNGCDRITIQPPVGKDGKHPEGYTFDEAAVEVITKGAAALPQPKHERGGPTTKAVR